MCSFNFSLKVGVYDRSEVEWNFQKRAEPTFWRYGLKTDPAQRVTAVPTAASAKDDSRGDMRIDPHHIKVLRE